MADALGEYLADIGRYPLINKEQEILLTRQMREWLDAPEPSAALERRGKRAYHKLVNCNLRLVVSVAKRYTSRLVKTDLLDLIQEGNIGLAHGIKKFDPERGYALSTYVFWWIRQAITRYLSYHERTIRLPYGAVQALGKLRSWIPVFRAQHGRLPTQAECAEHCEISVDRVREYMLHLNDCISTDSKVRSADSDTTYMDLIADVTQDPMEDIQWSMGLDSLDSLLGSIPETDQALVRELYGLTGAPAKTMSQVGRESGLSRERVRQKHTRALVKLRLVACGARVSTVAS